MLACSITRDARGRARSLFACHYDLAALNCGGRRRRTTMAEMISRADLVVSTPLLIVTSGTGYPQPAHHRVGPSSLYPTAATPGAVNPGVTQANINETICKSGWTATIRPRVSYTTNFKKQQLVD